MCITTAPAKLSKTKILSLRMPNGNHLLSYVNKAKNLSGRPNAMILPVPGRVKQEWFYDTTKYNNFLKDIEESIRPRTRSLSKGINRTLSVEDFQVGMYRVLLSADLFAIQDILQELPLEERPMVSSELYEFFASHYEGWNFVVCCFSGDQEMESQPIMFEYEPFYEDYLYYPGMDAHNGFAPLLTESVDVDHTLITEDIAEYRSNYNPTNIFTQKDFIPSFLLTHYTGKMLSGPQINGDWYVNIRDINAGILEFVRSAKHPGVK